MSGVAPIYKTSWVIGRRPTPIFRHRSKSIILQISKSNSHELVYHDEELEEGRAGGQNALIVCLTDPLGNI